MVAVGVVATFLLFMELYVITVVVILELSS
jgi:hypothetical protein